MIVPARALDLLEGQGRNIGVWGSIGAAKEKEHPVRKKERGGEPSRTLRES